MNPGPATEAVGTARAVPGAARPRTRSHRRPVTAAALLLGLAAAAALLVEPFRISSDSMRPTLEVGDRVLVEKMSASSVARGDIIVFVGDRVLGSGGDYVKRVIGVGGDRVSCCEPQGRLQVNGRRLPEPYLEPGSAASAVEFDVEVPADRLWVMGDHRSVSVDSRSRLGAAGGGMLPVEDVVGRVLVRYWPPGTPEGEP